MSAHSYWRAYFPLGGSTGGVEVAVEECQFYDSLGGRVPTVGGTASASGQYFSYAAANAFDGDLATVWNCDSARYTTDLTTAAQWLEYQFPSPVAVATMVLIPWSATDQKTAVSPLLQFSDNGETWTNVGDEPTPMPIQMFVIS